MTDITKPLYIAHLQIHGLIRSDPQLGFDADTGGQILYVLDLASQQAKHERFRKVEIITRKLMDPNIDASYAVEREPVCDGCDIVRIDTDPVNEYIKKEELWPHLRFFADKIIQYFSDTEFPDVIHAHYADAGKVASYIGGVHRQLTIFTGHSLGISKKNYLRKLGLSTEEIDKTYNMHERIAAEEMALQNSDLVICSSHHEKYKQYDPYGSADNDRIKIISPGVDLTRFSPDVELRDDMRAKIEQFFTDRDKPIILAITRPVKKKNIQAMVHAYGLSPELQEKANLCLILGTRDDITQLDMDTQEILTDVLLTIDKYDLYGKVAYPKTHKRADIPGIYSYAYKKRGIFVNVAYTEPFGLTALEAAASGLPCVVTRKGGISEIISTVANGLIVPPDDPELIGSCCLELINNDPLWDSFSANGLRVESLFSWENHVENYIKILDTKLEKMADDKILFKNETDQIAPLLDRVSKCDVFLVTEIDDILIGDKESMKEVRDILNSNKNIFFCVATGRSVESAKSVLHEHGFDTPDVLIVNVGSEIYYNGNEKPDLTYSENISTNWKKDKLKKILDGFKFLNPQDECNQSKHKLSFNFNSEHFPNGEEEDFSYILKSIRSELNKTGSSFTITFSHNQYLDVLPTVACKGNAVRYLALQIKKTIEDFVIFSADSSLLNGGGKGIVPKNFEDEIEYLPPTSRISEYSYARSIVEYLRNNRLV